MARIHIFLIAVTLLCGAASTSDLSRCCNVGARRFRSSAACGGVDAVAGPMCRRTASICCLRALLDAKCDEGAQLAKNRHACRSRRFGQLGGGLYQECCDCCLLAQELSSEGRPCVAPEGVGQGCKRIFEGCCERPFATFTASVSALRPGDSAGVTASIATSAPSPLHGDRCATTANRCAHHCTDKGGPAVQCTCRTGYSLGLDGKDCIGIFFLGYEDFEDFDTSDGDGCVSVEGSGDGCDLETEKCVRLANGRHECQPVVGISTSLCTSGRRDNGNGNCVDIDECVELVDVCGVNERCVNTPGSYTCHCRAGFEYSKKSDECIDINECKLLLHDCTGSQQCINTMGSYRCRRILSCGTGYYLDDKSEKCKDVDECTTGTHSCGDKYTCRNTKGSFKCEPKYCPFGQTLDRATGVCRLVECQPGFRPSVGGRCEDLNECQMSPNPCRRFEQCINTAGSYYCRMTSDPCNKGYRIDRNSGLCVDVNECIEGGHTCAGGPTRCINTEGSYLCRCQAGFEYNTTTKRCEDVDECVKFDAKVCSFHGSCENTVGSFRCHCNAGYRLAADQRDCEDVDECRMRTAVCDQHCTNQPGTYQCSCDNGYTLSANGRSCEDIDECTRWQGASQDLCMGGCINTPGSYRCRCPRGYDVQPDGRTCKDIDECQRGECSGDDRICVNTLGSFRCHSISCPSGYERDQKFKKCCNRVPPLCNAFDKVCAERTKQICLMPVALPRLASFAGPSQPLFTLKGPHDISTRVTFDLTLRRSQSLALGVRRAQRSDFLMQKGADLNSAIVALKAPLDGPQVVDLQLKVKVKQRSRRQHNTYLHNIKVHVSQYSKDVYKSQYSTDIGQ